MKVVVRVELDVDIQAWALEYGITGGAQEVRRDVQEYVRNGVIAHLAEMDLLATEAVAEKVAP